MNCAASRPGATVFVSNQYWCRVDAGVVVAGVVVVVTVIAAVADVVVELVELSWSEVKVFPSNVRLLLRMD